MAMTPVPVSDIDLPPRPWAAYPEFVAYADRIYAIFEKLGVYSFK
jgi:hypothetical protein